MTCQKDNDQFANFDLLLKRRGRGRWKWSVSAASGEPVISGSECTRAGARYKAERALFLLMCASASRRQSTDDPARDQAGRCREYRRDGQPAKRLHSGAVDFAAHQSVIARHQED